jgi:peptidylprolyl isomerase
MIRRLAILATMFVALVGAVPAVAQQLPANLDKANALVIDTTKGAA